MIIEIKYFTGKMTVHVEQFLNYQGISKFKKLIYLIRSSATPECEDQIKEYIELETEQFKPGLDECQRYIVGLTSKITFAQKQVENAIYNRDQYRKNTENWKDAQGHVKCAREEVRMLKLALRNKEAEKRQIYRNAELFSKLLNFLNT